MPNQITSPRPQGEPQTPQDLTLSLDAIKQLDGLYCLNDLHRLSGGKAKDTPSLFFQTDHAKGLLAELEKESQAKGKPQPYIIRVVGKGKPQGTYTCRELVYAYANWISPAFYLVVIRTFDQVMTTTASYASRINTLCQELNAMTQCLSMAGRVLAVDGKQTKPQMVKDLNNLLELQQPQLPNLGE